MIKEYNHLSSKEKKVLIIIIILKNLKLYKPNNTRSNKTLPQLLLTIKNKLKILEHKEVLQLVNSSNTIAVIVILIYNFRMNNSLSPFKNITILFKLPVIITVAIIRVYSINKCNSSKIRTIILYLSINWWMIIL